jgi:hypothetical protein
MISVLPLKSENELAELFAAHSIEVNEFSGAVSAVCNGERLGYCLFTLDDKKMTVLEIQPRNDLALADGILRSALHNAVCAKVIRAQYVDSSPVEIFEKLGFILNREEKTLNISKLFKSCHSCSDKNT